MTTETLENVPTMRADEPETEIQPPPIRPSGFVSLVFGLLSILCLLGRPLLFLPLFAFLFGLYALRPAKTDLKPVGRTPAKIGLVLAAAFGAAGFFVPFFKGQVLGRQAELFSQRFLALIADGQNEYALQLAKRHINRDLSEVPLRELYKREPLAAESISKFREEEVIQTIREAGPEAEWRPVQSPRLFTFQGYDRAEVVLEDTSGRASDPVVVILEYRVDSKTGDGQWHVAFCDLKREILVAKGAE